MLEARSGRRSGRRAAAVVYFQLASSAIHAGFVRCPELYCAGQTSAPLPWSGGSRDYGLVPDFVKSGTVTDTGERPRPRARANRGRGRGRGRGPPSDGGVRALLSTLRLLGTESESARAVSVLLKSPAAASPSPHQSRTSWPRDVVRSRRAGGP